MIPKIKTRKISCDCDAVFVRIGTLKQVRELARKSGWYWSKFSGWVCPSCQKENQKEWVAHVQCPID